MKIPTGQPFLMVDTIESIKLAIWLIFILLLIINIIRYIEFERSGKRVNMKDEDWNKHVEECYEKGKYVLALNTLATTAKLYPRSAAVKWWQARCYFQQQKWSDSVEKFQACCLLEPYYRKSVEDYMAFIERNNLVPGVEGYIKQDASN